MKELKGKSAFVTGAGSGVGLGIARAFAQAGMRIALVDIREEKVRDACRDVKAIGGEALAITADVSDEASLRMAADAAISAFGPVHIAVNNAGVAVSGTPIAEVSVADWDWALAVNLYGVIHGIRIFVPHMIGHGEGGHIVNTASIGGLQVRPGLQQGAYSVTKYGVVALSEALELDLAGTGVGVSVLCPAAVKTRIYETAAARPARFGGPFERPGNFVLKPLLERDGIAPDLVGERVVRAIRDEEFFVFTHSAPRAWIEARHRRMMEAFDRAAHFAADVKMAEGA